MKEGRRRPTATSSFGVGRRENHDASAFYARFETPELSSDAAVLTPEPVGRPFVHGDARSMDTVADGSVALVVTSPPYFAGKQYEEELNRQGVPGSYLEYLQLLRDVFADCKRVLEPGGRLAVNVANLGRKPYRSLSADVVGILQDDLRLLLRGEVIWQKGEGASGSCAWGSFRSPANPVLRDVTERIVIASKGRFDRAGRGAERARSGLPHQSSLTSDEFMEATLDVWNIPPESARRVQHPAPFPVELPERLIHLYTFAGDLVLDPFMGSGSTLVAAARTGRRFVGYDLDKSYVAIARRRVGAVRGPSAEATGVPGPGRARPGADPGEAGTRVMAPEKRASAIAEQVVSEAGFTLRAKNQRLSKLGVTVGLVATDAAEQPWYFDVTGAFTTTRGGLMRSDAVWRALGRAHVLRQNKYTPLILLTSHLPRPGSEGDRALRSAGPEAIFDAVELLSDAGRARLSAYARGGATERARGGFWGPKELGGG